MPKLKNLAVCVLALLPVMVSAQKVAPSAAQAQTASDHRADETAIEQVMKQYHAAILAHDGATLSGLFLPDANLWLNVLTDSAYARAQAKSATTQKVRVSSYRDFAKLVSTTPKSVDPEHSNVVIHTDGTIAAVYFDFVFNVDGKANNRGSGIPLSVRVEIGSFDEFRNNSNSPSIIDHRHPKSATRARNRRISPLPRYCGLGGCQCNKAV